MQTSSLLFVTSLATFLFAFMGLPYTTTASKQPSVTGSRTYATEDAPETFGFHPTYFERLEAASRVVSQARDLKDFREEHDFAKKLSSLSHFAVREAVLETIPNLSKADFENSVDAPSGLLQNGQHEGLRTSARAVSSLCISHVAATVNGLITNEPWAIRILDAMGKPPSGVLEGAFKWLGAYKECNDVQAYTNVTEQPHFSGKYCNARVSIKPTQTFPINAIEIGMCIPDTCEASDMNQLLNEILIRWERTERVGVQCVKKEDSLDTQAIVAIAICSVLLVCMLLGTAVDLLYVQMPKWTQETFRTSQITTNAHSVEVDETSLLIGQKTAAKQSAREIGMCTKLLVSFSVYTNGSKLLSTDQPAGSLTCVHGIRFISMTWVVLGHAFAFLNQYSGNYSIYAGEVVSRWTFQAISNATVSVDSFFVLSGLLVAYLSLKEMKKKRGWRINWFLFYFHRFWRLTPAYMLLLMVYTCLSPYWGEGPMWPDKEAIRYTCKENWWTNLLYVNNLVNDKEMCFGHSWYLANDMQFYILSPLIFVPFFYHPVLGCVSSAAFLIGTAIAPGVIESNEQFSPASFVQVDRDHWSKENSFDYYYIKPWNRMGPYVIGLMAGYLLYRTDCKLRINKFLNLFLWAVAAGSAIGVLYGLYEACNGHPLSVPVASFYTAVFRQVWGLSVAWVIVACVTGNGGFVNTILSWSALVPVSRLTYCIYLLHIMMMNLFLCNLQSLFYLSDITITMYFLGILVVSYMAAFVSSLAFEAPMMGLEKIIFRRDKKSDDKRDLKRDDYSSEKRDNKHNGKCYNGVNGKTNMVYETESTFSDHRR